ncbi:MAG TPA: hypothetical protein VM241_04735 [Candidatus Thermoplasmatota archaeon]|nr:hypothetical protein [Candidatus Thermoplasmatota archaeon]
MSLLKLALPLLVLALAPLAHAQAPPNPVPAGNDFTVGADAPVGLVKEDNQQVIPYKGNVTVPVSVTLGCSLIAYQTVVNTGDADHLHVSIADPPAWAIADELRIDVSPTDCASGQATHTYAGSFPLAVAADAPGVTTQVLNFTADYAGTAPAATAPLPVAIQFHSDYSVVPSVQFPYAVSGKSANFTVTITNRGNARSMVMVEELHASTGTFSGLGSVVYLPPESKTFQVTFKAPDKCWTSAKVDFKAFSHYLLLDQRAGSYKGEAPTTWEFTNGVACTPGKDTTSKASPLGGLAVLPVVLGAALLARRRLL